MKTIYNPDSEVVKFTFAAHEYSLAPKAESVLEDLAADHAIKTLKSWGVCLLPEDEAAQELAKAEADKAYKASLKDWCLVEAQAYSKRIAGYAGTGFTPKPTADESYALAWLKANS